MQCDFSEFGAVCGKNDKCAAGESCWFVKHKYIPDLMPYLNSSHGCCPDHAYYAAVHAFWEMACLQYGKVNVSIY